MKLPVLKEIIEERKEKAIHSLSDSYAKNRLPLEEYERLVEYINKIESERELVVVEKIVAEHGRGEKPVYDDDEDGDDDEEKNSRFSLSSSNVAVLSSRVFSGPLKSGTEVVSILGSGHIQIRRADLDKKKTVLKVVSVLGDIVVSVESGIRVKNKVLPILADSSISNKIGKMTEESDPELVISGVAVLGDIKVKLIKE